MWLVWVAVKFVLWLVLCAFFLLWWKQGMILYMRETKKRERENQNNQQGYKSPADWKLPFEDVWVKTRDGERIHAWFIKDKSVECTRPTVLWFHGNAGNIGYRLPFARELFTKECDVMMVDYRGYGNSEGEPTEEKLTIDVQDSLDYLRARADVDKSRIFVFGQSLGGAAAIRLATFNQQTLAGMVLENTFSSIDDMVMVILDRIVMQNFNTHVKGATLIAAIRTFLYLYVTNHWNSLKAARTISLPVMLISGELDTLVPPSHMKRLYEAFQGVKGGDATMHLCAEGEHNETLAKDPVARTKMISFILAKRSRA